MYCPICHLPHVSSMHTMRYGNATLCAISLPGSKAANNSLLLFPWLDVDCWPKGCNYRPSMVHLIGITMEKRSRGKNTNDYKRLVGLLLFSNGLVAAEWINLPPYTCLMMKHPCLWNLSVTLHVRFRLTLCFFPLIWDFLSIFYVEILCLKKSILPDLPSV